MEASHDGNKNNLIPVDKLFSARPSTPIAVALPDRNDTGDNTGNVDKADNAADVSAQEPDAVRRTIADGGTATSETAEQQSKPMHATQPQTEQPGTVTAEDDDERFRPQNSQSQPAPDETATFKPIFEPGSVFDRVSKAARQQERP